MCGITGFLVSNRNKDLNYKKKIYQMTDIISHRGPDGFGFWHSNDKDVFFGHRRLSIIDLSKNGKQPMLSNNGRYVISFNGEIYNHKILRDHLIENKKVKFSNRTDTQVILELISYYGLEKTLKKLDGMFAFSIWDNFERKLSLVRDRYGEKPLYYYFNEGEIVFGSELKSIKTFFDKNHLEINYDATKMYNYLGYIPAPLSIYKNVFKVLPSELIEFHQNKIIKKKYWNQDQNKKSKNYYDENESLNNIEIFLEKSVKKMMNADVEVGCFLSGGIDSSLVTCLMQKNSKRKIKTFSVGFNEYEYDESKYAKKIAEYLDTDHHEIILSVDDMINGINDISKIFDEPFSDSSCLPTQLVSKFASKHLKVILSGDGADELFLGYNRYKFSKKIERINSFLSRDVRKTLQNILRFVPSNYFDLLSRPIQKTFGLQGLSHKVEKFSNILDFRDNKDFYKKSIIMDNKKLEEFINDDSDFIEKFSDLSLIESVQKNDINLYLPNDILTKVDRSSMKNSLEVRAPFLDHKLTEILNKIPLSVKFKNNNPKHLLKKILLNYLPASLFNRPKMGFGIPIDRWLRKEKMVGFCDDIFYSTEWEDLNYKNSYVKSVWNDYKKYKNFPPSKIWLYLMAGLWLKERKNN